MKRFKVLTIDGGGVLGLYSATILHHFETNLRKKYGDDTHIVDYVDLICGTSTGGLIALALALRIPTETICNFYEEYGSQIFPRSESFFALVRQTLLGGKFSDKPLRLALEKIFKDRKIGDSNCLLCIPTYDFTHGTYGIFKFDHKEGKLHRHNKLLMVDVALATSAAPTYFPLAQIELENNTQYVDGGVWANNPSLVGFTEAIKHFVGSGKLYQCIDLLSIASLNVGSGKPPLLNRHKSFIQWAPDLFQLSLIGQSEFAHIFLETIQREGTYPLTYTRIPTAKIDGQQADYIKLDSANASSFALMKQYGTDMYYRYQNTPNVQSFFTERKTYLTKMDSISDY
jgi:uncharacterized protein